ncbi:MAG TPA: agmatinase [Actinomycetota bacterium]|nr:agmatinase [Actinomycetota bacterium]
MGDKRPSPGVRVNRAHEPSYAGGPTFSKLRLVLEPSGLAGVDVAIVGAPTDETTSYRPGARFGPRAIRTADYGGGSPPSDHHMDLGLDPYTVLSVVDYGDVPVRPADALYNRDRIRETVGEIVAAGAVPVVLGGDHAIAYPDVSAVAEALRPATVGIVHFDAHADDAEDVWEVRYSHGTPLRYLVEEGWVRGEHVVQIGLRGYWPFPEEFAWARERGLRWFRMDVVEDRGIGPVIEETLEMLARCDHLFLSVDIDVVDPSAAPGTGTPEPGGMTARQLLRAVRRLAAARGFAGMEVVEVSPPYDVAEITARLAHRVVLEALSGLALHRTGRAPAPEDPTPSAASG